MSISHKHYALQCHHDQVQCCPGEESGFILENTDLPFGFRAGRLTSVTSSISASILHSQDSVPLASPNWTGSTPAVLIVFDPKESSVGCQ